LEKACTVWDNSSFHINKMTYEYVNAQKYRLTVLRLPKKAQYLNPNERQVNQKIKSDVRANRFYTNIKKEKDAVSGYLNKRFGRC